MTPGAQQWPGDVCVAVPAYKAASSLERFLPALLAVAPATHVCVVDDASYDGTCKVCEGFGVCCLAQKTNQGKGAALRRAFSWALDKRMEWVLTMDADGQHAVDDIERFFAEMRRGASLGLVIGARDIRVGAMPLARICSNTITSAILSWMTGRRILDSQCGFRLYSARLLRSVTLVQQRFEMESEVILKAAQRGMAISFVKVQTLYCSDQSHISHLRDTIRWLKAVVSIWLELRRQKS